MANRKVRTRTLVGVNREGLYKDWAKRGFTKGCEVGVKEGVNAKAMIDIIPNLELLLVDPYMKYEYKHFKSHKKWQWHQPTMDKIRQTALKTLSRANVRWLMTTSIPATACIDDESLDFVYIDGNHTLDFVMQDILSWSRKVRKGGVISGHDYRVDGANTAVRAYAKHHKLEICLTDNEMEPKKRQISWCIDK